MIDDDGVELAGLDAVKLMAARSMAELALDVLPGCVRRTLRFDVRDELGRPIMVTELTFAARVLVEPAD